VPVDAALRIGGTVTDPELSADPGVAARGLADAVQDEVQSQVQETLDQRRQQLEDRAVEAVERLLPTPDTTRRPGLPGVSDLRRLLTPNRARPDTTAPAPDSTPPDSVAPRPDSVTGDSIPAADTARPDTARSTS
ncbi:MAG: hypothetical protein R3362_13120, partial [Rhodothermales bacterium]|nr:hypothetical protein [Rhodothermales bacterium]